MGPSPRAEACCRRFQPWNCAHTPLSGFQTRRRQGDELIASLVWTREHWLHEIRITRSYRHQNICAFLDAYCTPTDATLYLELYDLGTLKDRKDNMDANGQKMDEIHVLNFLIQLTAPYATCTMALNRTWKQPPATLVRYRAGNGCAHRYMTRSSLPSDAFARAVSCRQAG